MFRIIPVVFLRDLNYADQDFYMWEMKGGDQGRQINIIECQQNQGIVPGVFFFFFSSSFLPSEYLSVDIIPILQKK